MDNAKQLVDDDVVGDNPANEREVGQSAEQVVGDEVPDGGAGKCDEEEPLTAHTTTVTNTSIVLGMQGVEQSANDELGGPD